MSAKINPSTNDWTRKKYRGLKPLAEVEPMGAIIVLDEYLKSINLSQRSLAELCDLSQPAINDLCENRTQLLNPLHLARICSVLNIELTDIIRIVPAADAAYKN